MEIFDFIKLVFDDKGLKQIKQLSDEDLKQVQPFMISRFLASHEQLIPFVHAVDKVVLSGKLDKRQYLIFMWNWLPKGFFKLNFPIKDKNEMVDEYYQLILDYYKCSKKTGVLYYHIIEKDGNLKQFVENFGIEFGKKKEKGSKK